MLHISGLSGFSNFDIPMFFCKDKKPIVEDPMAFQEYLAVPLAEFCSGPIPSKFEWSLTNGPLSKLLELLDTQV